MEHCTFRRTIFREEQPCFKFTTLFFPVQSVIQMSGFRSLGENEEVEFVSEKTSKGLEAIKVRSPSGGECKGSERRPAAKKKFKKIRLNLFPPFLFPFLLFQVVKRCCLISTVSFCMPDLLFLLPKLLRRLQDDSSSHLSRKETILV